MIHRAFALVGLGEKKSAVAYLQDIIRDPTPSGPAKRQARLGLGFAYYIAGDLVQMEQLAGPFLDSTNGNEPASATANLLGSLFGGLLRYDQNRLDEAKTQMQHVQRQRHYWNYLAGFYSWFGLVRIQQLSGHLQEAQSNIDDLRADCTRLDHAAFLRTVEILQAYQRLLEGDASSARSWALAYQPSARIDALFAIDPPDLLWSRILLATGSAAERQVVLSYLHSCLVPLKNSQFSRRKIQLLSHMAAARIALDQDAVALDLLRQALLLAEPGGIVRSFADAGPSLLPSLQLCQDEGITPDLIPQIQAAFSEPSPRPSMATATLLTKRETEILCLMQDGLSNKEIALSLFISMHTAKRHASNIYSKLDVNGRQEAIFRAQELAILP